MQEAMKAVKPTDALNGAIVTIAPRWYVEYGKGQLPEIPDSNKGRGIILSGFQNEDAARDFVRKALNQGFTVHEVGALGDLATIKIGSASIREWCEG